MRGYFLRAINDVKSALEKGVDKLKRQVEGDQLFEEESKLRLPYTKNLLKQRGDKFNEVIVAMSKLDEKFLSSVKKVNEETSKVDIKGMGNYLREVGNKLESAEREGKEAGKLLLEAQVLLAFFHISYLHLLRHIF